MKKMFAVLAAILFLAIMACGGGGDSATSGSNTSPQNIGTAGGTMVSSDGKVTLNVPSGALNNTIQLTIQKSTLSDNIGAAGQPYDFGPDGTILNIPAHVTISYDTSSLPAGINEGDLALAYFTANGWEIIESSIVNQTNHSIEGDLPHFSTVGVSPKNSYPQTLVKETDFNGHLASAFRGPIGDDGTNDFGGDISLLSIGTFSTFQYPKIRFNTVNASNGWYVAVAFNQNRWLNKGWNSEPSSDTSYYDDKHDYHPGEDWNITSGGSNDAGKPVHAIANGIVLFNGWKYGNTVILGHKLASGEIVASVYGHLQSKPNLSVGALINKGDVIGNIGNTGTTAFHLHFEIAKGIGADGTSYMLKKNSSNEIVFNNESTYTTGGQKYYDYFWLWPGTNSILIDTNWYPPSDFIIKHQNISGTITEFSTGISAGAGLTFITAGPDGNIWFAESNISRIGRITPTGVVTEFSAGITTGNGGFGELTAGPDGNVWFTKGDRIGRITPTGVVTEFTAGITANASILGITAGPDGNLWFTEEQGNRIGRITPTGVVTEFSTGTPGSTIGAPCLVAAGPDGNLWFTEERASRIGRITPAGVITEFTAGITATSLPGYITAGPDGNLWFIEGLGNRIGRITPAGVITEFSIGGNPDTDRGGITAGPDGNLWFTNNDDSRIGRITPTGVVTEFSTGIAANAHPAYITAGPDGNLWFTEGINRIGRITP